MQFVRKFPATFNTEQWPPLIERLLAKASAATGTRLQPDDVDHYYFTQVNLRTIEATMATLGQPLDQNPLDHGQMGLYRLGLHPDGAGRRDQPR